MGLAAKKMETIDLDAVLGTAKKADTKGKSTVQVIKVTEKVMQDVDKIRELKEQLDSTQTMLDLMFAELQDAVKGQREQMCKQGYTSSLKIPSVSGKSVTISWKDAYSKIGVENEDTIKGIVGERYDNFFAKKLKIEVKDNLPEGMLTELVQAIGPERFAEFFEVQRWLLPTSRYTTEYYTAFAPEERAQLGVVVKQYKPTLKTK